MHSAEDWDELLLPEIERQQAAGKQVAFRGDAAFAKPEVYEASEERGVQYAIRIPANKSLELEIEDILFRPPGRPSRKPLVRYKSFRYQAESWSKARRIVAKVEHHQGELFPRVGFIVTSMSLPSRSVVRFYNKRGTAEQWIKEGKQATHWTRLSCHRFPGKTGHKALSVKDLPSVGATFPGQHCLSLVALLGADTPLSIIGDRMRTCQRSVGFSESSFACSWRLGGRITRHIFTPTIRTMSGFSGSIPLSCLRETYHEGSAGWSKRGRNCIKMN